MATAEGILDITHVPGVFQGVLNQKHDKTRDHRIGIFYDQNDPTKPCRVMVQSKATASTSTSTAPNANAHWDRLGGRHFVYYLSKADRDLMAAANRASNTASGRIRPPLAIRQSFSGRGPSDCCRRSAGDDELQSGRSVAGENACAHQQQKRSKPLRTDGRSDEKEAPIRLAVVCHRVNATLWLVR